MLRVYISFFCLILIALAGCNKAPVYVPASSNTTQLYGFGLERTTSNPNLNRFYNGMIMGDTAVHLTVDYGTDITSLEPTVLVYADSIFPKGKQNFANPVKYTVWANGKSAVYTVRITVSSIQNPVVQAIAAGPSHVLALRNDGTLWAVGDNTNGQLGMGDYSSRITITQVPAYDVTRVFTGDCGTVIMLKDGSAWATGNGYGQLGIGNTNSVVGFIRQPFLDDAVQVVVTFGEFMVLKPDGTLWGAGRNNTQLLAQGDNAVRSSFVKLPISGVSQVSGVGWDLMVQKTNGEIWGWGYNFLGELGLGDSTLRPVPTKIPAPGNISKIFCGGANTFLIDNGGQVWAVGTNVYGELGFGDQAKHLSFTAVPFFNGKSITDVQNASGFTMFKDGAGDVYGVGANYIGQLAQGSLSTLPYLAPVLVKGITAKSIYAQGEVAFALKTDASLWGWGGNPAGVLAIAQDSAYATLPVQIFK